MASGRTGPSSDDVRNNGDNLIDSFQWPAKFNDSSVEHARRVTDRRAGIRNGLRVERWSREGELGRGGFGTVYLERESGGAERAVKQVKKQIGKGRTMAYLKEVLAMAALTKVCLLARSRPSNV